MIEAGGGYVMAVDKQTRGATRSKAAGRKMIENEAKAIGRRIRALRDERRWSQADLARRASTAGGHAVTQQNVADYELGKAQRPRYLPEIARAFNTTVEALRGQERPAAAASATAFEAPMIPVIGTAAAGRWLAPEAFEEEAGEQVPRAMLPNWAMFDQFAVRVAGPSMNRRVPDGATAVCVPYESARPGPVSGDLVFAVCKRGRLEEWSIKLLRMRPDAIELHSESTDLRFKDAQTFDLRKHKQIDDPDVTLEIRGLVITALIEFTPR
jgi:transcriptional regulator with XRE-family HTH domain